MKSQTQREKLIVKTLREIRDRQLEVARKASPTNGIETVRAKELYAQVETLENAIGVIEEICS